eukprot:7444531-Alexandrium_andersonii.AAC.1
MRACERLRPLMLGQHGCSGSLASLCVDCVQTEARRSSVCLSVCLSLRLRVGLVVRLIVRPSICPSVRPS